MSLTKSADDTFSEAPLSSNGKSESLMNSQPMGSSEGSLKSNVDPTEALYSSAGSKLNLVKDTVFDFAMRLMTCAF